MGRAPCCDKANVKRGPWSPEEDATLKTYVQTFGTGGNWIALPRKAGLKRCGKSCRLRWLNYLRPDIKHGGFTEEEDNIIFNLYSTIGSRWSVIASQLPGRTDNDVKNHWNTKLKKKLIASSTVNSFHHTGNNNCDPLLLPYNNNANGDIGRHVGLLSNITPCSSSQEVIISSLSGSANSSNSLSPYHQQFTSYTPWSSSQQIGGVHEENGSVLLNFGFSDHESTQYVNDDYDLINGLIISDDLLVPDQFSTFFGNFSSS